MKEPRTDIDIIIPQPQPERTKMGREDRHKSAEYYKREFYKKGPDYSESEGLEKSRNKFLRYQTAIDIGFFEGRMKFTNWELLSQKGEVNQRLEGKQIAHRETPSPFPAVDQKEKTIIIRLHLDRKRADIFRDVKDLLNLLDKEATHSGLNFKRVKSHLDAYDNMVRVYDLKKVNPKMTWSQIAKIIFPKEVYKNLKGEDLAMDSARDKVRNYWRRAKEMIEEGGWKRI